MLQTTNYNVDICPVDYNPSTRPIFNNVSLARNILIHGAVWFNTQMLLCTNHDSSDAAQNKALLNGMFAAWVEEYNEWNEASCRDSFRDLENNHDNIMFELCDVCFVAFGMQAMFSELDIQNLSFTLSQRYTWLEITQIIQRKREWAGYFIQDTYKISLAHARATVLSNASKFFPYDEKAQNAESLTVWDSHIKEKIPVRIAHNGEIGCLVDAGGKVRKKAEFGYKSKEEFLLEIQNGKI